MLIDSSYFTGTLTIPQLGQSSVIDDLNIFIERNEPLFLQAALGYELWQDFFDGLNADPIDPIWTNLRDGVDFQNTGMWPPWQWANYAAATSRDWFIPQNPQRRQHWVGFCGGVPNPGTSNPFGNIKVLIVGSDANSPVAGTDTFTLASLAGTTYTIERRGFGTMNVEDPTSPDPLIDEVSITNNGQTITLLKTGDKFNGGEVFILHFISTAATGSPSQVYVSPLARYIYYQWFRDNAGNLSPFGVVQGQAENAKPALSMLKMSDAFNGMAPDMMKLWAFLDQAGTSVYASYDRLKIDYNFFKPINKYGI